MSERCLTTLNIIVHNVHCMLYEGRASALFLFGCLLALVSFAGWLVRYLLQLNPALHSLHIAQASSLPPPAFGTPAAVSICTHARFHTCCPTRSASLAQFTHIPTHPNLASSFPALKLSHYPFSLAHTTA